MTVDINFVCLDEVEPNQQALRLMALAESMGLPVEVINQAGSYFFSKIEDAKDHLVLVHESSKCRIFRPDVYLFLELKLARFTASDFEDCVVFAQKNADEFKLHKKQLSGLCKKALKKMTPEAKQRALEMIRILKL